jgi:hypothetical protein
MQPIYQVETTHMPTPIDDPTPARRSRWYHRREPAPCDSVVIGDEDNHAWWSQRDDLTRLAAPKKHGRVATVQPVAPHAAFAPPAEAEAVVAPPQRWDLDSLYEWGATSDDVGATVATDDHSSPTAWQVLELTPDASWLEVVRQHRSLAKSHHPDLQSHSDLSARRVAELRMAEINAAFDSLGSIYGMGKGA